MIGMSREDFFFGPPCGPGAGVASDKTLQHWNSGCKGQVRVKGCNIFSCTSTPPKVKQQWDSGCKGQARVSEKSAMHIIRQLFIARSGSKFRRLYDNGCSCFLQVMYRYLREVKMTMLANIFCFCWSCPTITDRTKSVVAVFWAPLRLISNGMCAKLMAN